jgi:Fuc2NAc and GlcNAc transferase
MDIPGKRSSHEVPTPRGGGVAIVITWFVGVLIFYLHGYIEKSLFLALSSGIILVIISFLDDLLTLPYSVRLLFQVLGISLGIYFLDGLEVIDFGFFQLSSPLILSIAVVFGLIWFVNLYNFLDGIDGYAAMEAIFVLITIYIFTGNVILLFLASSVLGFIYWNWQRAKIFMGDVGSILLGYTIGILAVYFHKTNELSLLVFAMLSSLFWFDATITLFRRAKNKEKLTEAHKKHAYQRFVQGGYSHKQTVLYSIVINLVLFGIAYLATIYTSFIIPFLLLNLIFLYLLVRRVDTIKPFE